MALRGKTQHYWKHCVLPFRATVHILCLLKLYISHKSSLKWNKINNCLYFTDGELSYYSVVVLPVSQVADGDAPDQEADVERGLVHVHQPSICTHQVKLEQTHNVDNNLSLSLQVFPQCSNFRITIIGKKCESYFLQCLQNLNLIRSRIWVTEHFM